MFYLVIVAPTPSKLHSPSQAAEYLGTSIHSITEEGAVAAGWPLFFAGFLDAQYRFDRCFLSYFESLKPFLLVHSTVLSCCCLPLGRLAASSTPSSSSSAAAAAVWVYSGNQYLVPLLQVTCEVLHYHGQPHHRIRRLYRKTTLQLQHDLIIVQANAHYRPLLLRLFGSHVDKYVLFVFIIAMLVIVMKITSSQLPQDG